MGKHFPARSQCKLCEWHSRLFVEIVLFEEFQHSRSNSGGLGQRVGEESPATGKRQARDLGEPDVARSATVGNA